MGTTVGYWQRYCPLDWGHLRSSSDGFSGRVPGRLHYHRQPRPLAPRRTAMIPWKLLDRFDCLTGGELSIGARRTSSASPVAAIHEQPRPWLREALALPTPSSSGANMQLRRGRLGMGFTWRRRAAQLGPDAGRWWRNWSGRGGVNRALACLGNNPITGRARATYEIDVARVLRASATFDAILLDVDNGPRRLTRDANDGSMATVGLRRRSPPCASTA